jgi:hypothetical protein
MSRSRKLAFLHDRGWRRRHDHRWEHWQTGAVLPFGQAVRYQLEQDIARGR